MRRNCRRLSVIEIARYDTPLIGYPLPLAHRIRLLTRGGNSMSDPTYSFAIFPFLKTRRPVSIGGYTFRSTDDKSGLNESQAKHLEEIAAMMFLQDGFRIRSGSYALVPHLTLERSYKSIEEELERLQSVIAYCYSSPNETSGRPFFAFERKSSHYQSICCTGTSCTSRTACCGNGARRIPWPQRVSQYQRLLGSVQF
jgi:hypothetical protein